MLKLRHVLIAAGGLGSLALGAFAVLRVRRTISRLGPVTAIVTINRPPRDVYELLRDFPRLPEFMTYLQSVEEDGDYSTWTATLPAVGEIGWKAHILEDVPGVRMTWEAVGGERVRVTGRVTFQKPPGRDATEVRVELELDGSEKLARILTGPLVKGELRRLKAVLETGEVLRSDASAHRAPHAAQPAADAEPAPDFYIPHVANVVKGAVS